MRNDGDTINFDPSVNIVTLTTAELVIAKSITISASPQMVTVQRASQAPQFRIFHVMPGHSVEINGLTISGGHITDDNGGGILNDNSTLTIAHCTVNGNAIVSASVANISGGGIHNSGTMTLNQVIVNNNNAVCGGGGPDVSKRRRHLQHRHHDHYCWDGSIEPGLLVRRWHLQYRHADHYRQHDQLTTKPATLVTLARSGGGIINDGTMTIQDSTISGNTARRGRSSGW